MTSLTDVNSPTEILDTPQPHIGLSQQELSALFTDTFAKHLKTLHDLQSTSLENRPVSRRISTFIDIANEAIATISSLKSAITEANDPKNEPSRQTEDTIDMAYLCALTALNKMFTLLGSGGTYNASLAGVASQMMAGDIARYLDYVKVGHTPKDFEDEDESEKDESGDDNESEGGNFTSAS